MVAGATEVAVIGAALLLAIGRALARIHVEHDDPRRMPLVRRVNPLARQIGECSEFLGWVSRALSKRPIWLAEAAAPWIARLPTTHRIAGSRHSRSASFTSS